MTDDLRTRIAKVLHDIYGNMLRDEGREWGDEPHMIRDDYLRDADAVIRELTATLPVVDLDVDTLQTLTALTHCFGEHWTLQPDRIDFTISGVQATLYRDERNHTRMRIGGDQ